ncbi:Protein farnesyltransferase beta subunit [Giardia duodenalis]|uniref:Protein farnesyltransferase beta subunit n=1 Tax=Giardia intestinalis TaxID=5741 RepID=V6T7H6_GIAIN|nr:Protein farnesyltransferase beta subunit [Giardia intestinalis]
MQAETLRCAAIWSIKSLLSAQGMLECSKLAGPLYSRQGLLSALYSYGIYPCRISKNTRINSTECLGFWDLRW